MSPAHAYKCCVFIKAFNGLQGGNLQQALSNNAAGELDWHRRGRNIALDIARGLTFLHATGVVHRYSPLISEPRGPAV